LSLSRLDSAIDYNSKFYVDAKSFITRKAIKSIWDVETKKCFCAFCKNERKTFPIGFATHLNAKLFFFWVDWHRRGDVGKAIFIMKRARKKLLGLAQEGVGWKGWKEKQSSAELLIVRNSFIL
jgi:hypothetical protein